jgi:hypothetical protein
MIKEVSIAVVAYLFGAFWIITAAPFFTLPVEGSKMAVSDNLTEIEQIVQSVHDSHPYVNGSYTCFNYTLDTIALLNSSGYEAYYIYGQLQHPTPGNGAHAWVRACLSPDRCRDFDVTGGNQPPNPSLYNRTLRFPILPSGKPGTSF